MRLSLEKKNNNNNNKRSRFNRVLCTIGARSLIRNLITYLLPLPNKNNDSGKRDKTSGLDRNDHQTCSRLLCMFLIRKGSIKYFLLLLWASEDFLHLMNMSCMK